MLSGKKVIIIGASGHGATIAAKAELLKHEVTLIDIEERGVHLTDGEKRELSEIANRLNSNPEPYMMEMIPEMECNCRVDDFRKENVKFYDHYYKKGKKR